MGERLLAIAQEQWPWFRYLVAGVFWPAFYAVFGATGNEPVVVALTFIGWDCVTGILRALSTRQGLSSSVGYRGLVKKSTMLALIGFGHALDQHVGSGNTFKTFLAYYVSSIEIVSILENLAATGVPMPEGAKRLLLTLIADQQQKALAALAKPSEEGPEDRKGGGSAT